MISSDLPPAVHYIRNRMLILVASLPIVFFSLSRILVNLKSGDPWLNWLAGLVVWLTLFFMALRRRLVLAQDWLEYTDWFRAIRIPWAQVERIATRKTLGIWNVEGLEAWTVTGGLKRTFIDLTQFDRSWRQADLGRVLRAYAPRLFQESALGGRAS